MSSAAGAATQNPPWRHHHTPQFVLKGFSDARGKLFFFDKDEPTQGVQHDVPREIFYEEDLYSAINHQTGEFDPALEFHYGKVETKAAPIIKKIVDAARKGMAPGLTPKQKADFDLFLQYQLKRSPDVAQKFDFYEDLDRIVAELRNQGLTAEQESWVSDPELRARLARNARVSAQGNASPAVAAVQASRGVLVAAVSDPEAFIIGSNALAPFPAPGMTNLAADGGKELWLPVTSDVAVSIGGPPGSEHFVQVTDHEAIRRLNELTAKQSKVFGGRSRALVEALALNA